MDNGDERPRARGRAAAIGARAGPGWAGLLADRPAAGFAALAALVQTEARASWNTPMVAGVLTRGFDPRKFNQGLRPQKI
jgi:hypothetical protein